MSGRSGSCRRPGLLGLVLLGGLGFRFALAVILPPGYDEAYYLFYGHHLALSYFDHPAAVGLWSWAGQQLGHSILALRVPSLLSYTVALGLLTSASERWFGRRAALMSLLLGSLCPVLLLCGGVLLLPDSPLLLALATLLWWLSRHPDGVPNSAGEAIGLGTVLGLVTLGKYHALLVLLSLLGWSLSTPQRRGRFRSPWPGLAVLVWLVVSSPLWIWNIRQGWVSFLFQAGRLDTGGGYSLAAPPLFLLSQTVLLFPTLALVLGLTLLPRRDPGPAVPQRQLIRWLVLPQLVVFLLLAGRMHVLASWLVPAWWMLLPLAGEWLAHPPPPWRRGVVGAGVRATALFLPPFLLFLAVQVRWGVLDAWLPAGLDNSTELLPAERLRRDLQRHPAVWKALMETPLIVGNRYDLPGFLALALGPEHRADYTTFNPDARGFAWWQPADGFVGRRGVIFGIREPGRPLVPSIWAPWLGDLEPLGPVDIHRAGRAALRLEFFRFGPLPHPWPRFYGPEAVGRGAT